MSTNQKIGTLRCRLFGHKFLIKYIDPEKQIGLRFGQYILTRDIRDWCVLCGITRQELHHGEKNTHTNL